MKAYIFIWFGLMGLCVSPFTARAQVTNLVGAEYFFNSDPGFGNGSEIPFNSGPNVNFTTQINTSGLGLGFHRISVRFLDSNGSWGLINTRTLWIGRTTAETTVPIVGAEYFFNKDPGIGNGISIPVTSGLTVDFNTIVNTSGLAEGFNRISLRVQDQNGNWSLISTKTFWIGKANPDQISPIVAAEYFYNEDPGFGNGTSINVNPGLNVDISTNVTASGLSDGLNRLSLRVQDQNGNWSLIQTKIFWIGKVDPNLISPIVGAEYFFNVDPGFGNGTALNVSSGLNPQVEGEINVGNLPRGFHRISVRFRNQDNVWGLIQTKLIFVENEGFSDPAFVDYVEYFFDEDDPGLGEAIEIPLEETASAIDLEALIAVADLEEGEHTISVRIKNNRGLWSIVETREFTVGEPQQEEPPIPDLETLPDLIAECEINFGSLSAPTATANDGSTIIGTTDEGVFPVSRQGITTIVWTYRDANGLESTQNQDLVVDDVTPPTIILPAEIIAEANSGQCFASSVNLGSPVTTDNCGIGSVINNAPGNFPVGLTEVLWTVTDVGGNTAQFLQIVTVLDNQPPVLTEIADITVSTESQSCTASNISLPIPQATDNCGIASLTNDAPEEFPVGTTVVTWTAVDGTGNITTRSLNVIVEDNQAPVITAPTNISIQIGEDDESATAVELGTPTTSDNCGVDDFSNDAPRILPNRHYHSYLDSD
jgi:hypothetical protein